jgi:predicted nicotinamide N-methyase
LVLAQLKPSATVVFTDQDPGVLKTIAYNCTQQSMKQATCMTEQLRWGEEGAADITAFETQRSANGADMIVGTDVIYMREVVSPLFWSVDRLLTKAPGGVFLMCSSVRYDPSIENEIDAQCERFGFARTIISCELATKEGGSRIQQFTRAQ